MATLILRHNRYSAKVRIPKEMQPLYDGKEFLQKTLGTSDRRLARVEAGAWEATLRLEWSGLANTADPTTGSLRAISQGQGNDMGDAATGVRRAA